jgi:hypothetical protein
MIFLTFLGLQVEDARVAVGKPVTYVHDQQKEATNHFAKRPKFFDESATAMNHESLIFEGFHSEYPQTNNKGNIDINKFVGGIPPLWSYRIC